MTLKTPEEVAKLLPQAILSGMEYRGFYDCGKYLDEEVLEPVAKAITQDRQHIAEVLCELLEGEKMDNKVLDARIIMGNNAAIQKAQALIRQTLDPISN